MNNMNFIKLIRNQQDELNEDGVLIEYDLFFEHIHNGYCSFAIDDKNELKELNNIISKIKASDVNAEIYVCTYAVDFIDDGIDIYGDTLWINTVIELEKLYTFFNNHKNVEPSDIRLLSKDETIDGTVSMVFSVKDTVEDYKSFINKRQLTKIKSLYWD